MAPARTAGLAIHLLYPVISVILLAVAAFPSAAVVWYVSIQTETMAVRFATQDYCGYNVTNLVITSKLGCIQRGWQYEIPQGYFGVDLPFELNSSLSKVAVMTVVAFALILISAIHHAYTVRYSFRKDPAPNNDKLWSLLQIHFVSALVCFGFTWITFIATSAIISRATSYSNEPTSGNFQNNSEQVGTGVGIYWGQSVWLILAGAIIQFGWVWEAVRWRASML